MPRKLALDAQDCAYLFDYLQQAKADVFVEASSAFKADTIAKLEDALSSGSSDEFTLLLDIRLNPAGRKKALSSLRASRFRSTHDQSTIKLSADIFKAWSSERKKYSKINKGTNTDDFMCALIDVWKKNK